MGLHAVADIHTLGKTCPKCGEHKSATEFAVNLRGPRKGLLVTYCKQCNLAQQAKRRAKDKTIYERVERNSKYKRQYGITVDDYNRMLATQNDGCGICGVKTPGNRTKHFHVDHCHSTGKVRGLLCHKCNRALGLFSDNVDVLLQAAKYLSEESL